MWQVTDSGDIDRVDVVRQALSLHRVVADLLVSRGHGESPEHAKAFLDPQLSDLLPPDTMADLDRATRRVAEAIAANETIAVFGDYDVDGVSSAAIVADYLRAAKGKTLVRVSRREEGYGFQVAHAEELVRRECKVILLLDCGTNDTAAVDTAASQGADVIVVDHHIVREPSDKAYALVNPQRDDCKFEDKGLCTGGLAFYFVARLRRQLESMGKTAPDPRTALDLAALATLADVAPVLGANRVLVRKGLERLGATPRPGLRELMRVAELPQRTPTPAEVVWRLVPRLNAPGRIGDAAVAFSCLYEQDTETAHKIARRCDTLNTERRKVQGKALAQAEAQAKKQTDLAFLLVAHQSWHAGIVGILAARIADKFGKPTAAVAIEGDTARGSVRSRPGLDLIPILEAGSEYLVRFGGHAQAAGFTAKSDFLDQLRVALSTAAGLVTLESLPLVVVDKVVTFAEIDEKMIADLERFAPYGPSHARPILGLAGVTVAESRIVGGDHLSLVIGDQTRSLRAIGFGMADKLAIASPGSLLDLAFFPEINHYGGRNIQLKLDAIEVAGDGLTR